MTEAELLQQLHWRYAVKKFDATRKLTPVQNEFVKETLRLTPSSFGLQPWKFILVENPALRSEMRKISWNQSQLEDAATIVVFCRHDNFSLEHIGGYVRFHATVRGVTEESLKGYQTVMESFANKLSDDDRAHWTERQIYIAIGNLMTACAAVGLDACPLEGFDRTAMDAYLKLPENGWRSVVMCAVGFRASDDKYASQKKVRYPVSDVIEVR